MADKYYLLEHESSIAKVRQLVSESEAIAFAVAPLSSKRFTPIASLPHGMELTYDNNDAWLCAKGTPDDPYGGEVQPTPLKVDSDVACASSDPRPMAAKTQQAAKEYRQAKAG